MKSSPGPVLERTFRGHRNAVTSTAFHPSMQQLASGSVDGTVMIWNFKNTMRAFRYVGHRGPVYDVAVSPRGNLVASVSADSTLRLWIPTVKGESSVIKAHTHAIRSVGFSTDAAHIITGSDDKIVKLWNTSTQKFAVSFQGHQNWVRSTAISPDGRVCASGGDDRVVHLWDTNSRRAAHSLYEHTDSVTAIAFHPDGNCVAAGSADQSIQLWDLRMVRRGILDGGLQQVDPTSAAANARAPLLQHYDAHGDTVSSLSFHPSGNWLASSSGDGAVKLWDLREGFLYCTINSHEGAVHCAAFSETDGGSRLATAGQDGLLMVWETSFLNNDFGMEADKRQTEQKQQQLRKPSATTTRQQQQNAAPKLQPREKSNSQPKNAQSTKPRTEVCGLNQSSAAHHSDSVLTADATTADTEKENRSSAYHKNNTGTGTSSPEQYSPLLCATSIEQDVTSTPLSAADPPVVGAPASPPAPTPTNTPSMASQSPTTATIRTAENDIIIKSLVARMQKMEAMQESLTTAVSQRDRRLSDRLDTVAGKLSASASSDEQMKGDVHRLTQALEQQSVLLQSVLESQQRIMAQQADFDAKLAQVSSATPTSSS